MKLKTLIATGLLALPMVVCAADEVTMDVSTMEIRANPIVSSPFATAVNQAREQLRARLEEIRNSGAGAEEQRIARDQANEDYHAAVNRARVQAREQRRRMVEKRELNLDANLEARLDRIAEQAE